MLMPLGKYATQRQREARRAHPKPAATLVALLTAARGEALQLLAASATVGRPLRRKISTLSGRSLKVVHDPHSMDSSRPDPLDETRIVVPSRNIAGQGEQSRAVTLPAQLQVEVLETDEDNVMAAVHQALASVSGTCGLLFIEEGRSVGPELQLIQQCGLPHARRLSDAILNDEFMVGCDSVSHSSPTVHNDVADDDDAAARLRPLLVGSPGIARGLDIPDVGLVILLGIPQTADQLVHLAGRTARQGEPGKVVIITTPEECGFRLPTIGSQLGRDLSKCRCQVYNRNTKWAQMWSVHQKVIQADMKNTPSSSQTVSVSATSKQSGTKRYDAQHLTRATPLRLRRPKGTTRSEPPGLSGPPGFGKRARRRQRHTIS
mmetsp:Transcript_8072/g.13607  ORF Transcript_8072/g.13607 Transcript_8072/m.13607 type:complete len:376 (-) Transcript_8072:411-1538(-)